MSHEITREDSLILARSGAWHGLGTVLADAPSIPDALKLSGLDWRVLRRRLEIANPTPEEIEAEPMLLNTPARLAVAHRIGLQRSDTGRVLEVVGDGYEVLQNADLFELAAELQRAGDIARVESAGSLKQGRRVFLLVPQERFTVGRADEVASYVLFSNTHDGTGALGIIPTTVRVVCANTLRAAEAGFRIRHSQNMGERIAGAREALRMAGVGALSMRKAIERLASVPMDDEDRRVFFLKVYEAANGRIPAKAETEADERARAKAAAIVGEWIANLDSARNTGTGTEGTLWHALNAATEWSDHKRTVRTTEDTERAARANSNLFGTSAAFKAKALEVALQAAQ